MNSPSDELKALYGQRFQSREEYRNRVWQVLVTHYFQRYVTAQATVLDLGCGYGEFINHIACGTKYAMDLNPSTAALLAPEIYHILQNCSAPWPIGDNALDVVFTSNFFEHLPDKATLGLTLAQAHRCLKPGGLLVAMGPNIKYLPGQYWDFWDHLLPLTEASLQEGLVLHGFEMEECHAKFLPFTMSNAREYPMAFLKLYLKMPALWSIFGKQFLIIARKTSALNSGPEKAARL
jgi:SAM-dependent methyltransferase